MPHEQLHDLDEIEQYLRGDVYLHLYGIGDLDPFFRPYVAWYGLRESGRLAAVVLAYRAPSLPAVLALSRDTDALAELLRSLAPALPEKFYAHLSPGVEPALAGTHVLQARGLHHKMALRHMEALDAASDGGARPMTPADADELHAFYRESYPESWFDPRMLETGRCFGLRIGNRLVSAAGIHVYSAAYRVAALGNIATLPSRRGRGCGRAVTAGLCRALQGEVDHIGLNVKADNAPAIACYERLGFTQHASYGEFVAHKM